jgi:hypothetical protein
LDVVLFDRFGIVPPVLGALVHANIFSGIGRPTALRIISFVQAARQMYFLGSSMDMARLSPLVSRFAWAHDRHWAI